jgi:hypothetical protein
MSREVDVISERDFSIRTWNRRRFLKSAVFGILSSIILLRTRRGFGATVKQEQSLPETQSRDTGTGGPGNETTLRFFNNHQRVLVSTMAGLIVALDANQNEVADTMVSDIDNWVAEAESKKKNYAIGLNWIDTLSRRQYGSEQGFLGLKKAQKLELLARISKSWETRRRRVDTVWQRVQRKLDQYWDNVFGVGPQANFFHEIRADAIASYYSNPVSWLEIGYYGPPQPVGYLQFDEPPEFENHTDSVRTVNNATCLGCHETGRHSRGGGIDLSCTSCHRPHSPWLYGKDQPRLEDQIGIIFPNLDKKKK